MIVPSVPPSDPASSDDCHESVVIDLARARFLRTLGEIRNETPGGAA
ncbi:hypothetical protein [Aeromicrobium sp.]